MQWYKFFILTLVFFIFPTCLQASLSLSEIYPAPLSGEFEWVEVVNISAEPVSLSNFYITDASNKKIQFPLSTLEPFTYATATSSSVLNNTDETVNLHNVNGELLETITYGTLDNSSSFTKCGTTWKTTKIITKQKENNESCIVPTPTILPTPLLTPTIGLSPSPTVTPPAVGIVLSEFYPYPTTGEKEWFEIYNNSNTTVTLENWYIDDAPDEGSKPYKFSLTINPYGFGVIELQSSILNNTADSIRLLTQDGDEITKFVYSK